MNERNTEAEKIPEEKNSLEKLMEKQLFYTRIFAVSNVILVAAVLLVILKVIPNLTATLTQASGALTSATQMMEDASDTIVLAESALARVQPMMNEFEDVTDNVNELVDSSSAAVEEAMDKIKKMDIEKLNEAIQDLSDVVEPLAKFFNRFN